MAEKDIVMDKKELDEENVVSRTDRPTGSTHYGDVDFADENTEEIGDASWSEVCHTCCVHTPREWVIIFFGIFMVCFFLYFFLLGLNLLGSAAKVLGGCAAGSLFGDDTNPVAGVMIGIICTVLIQSSSSTTSIIVSLVGAGSVSVKTGIYMVMGANIGTSVTNTIVAMGHLGDGDELERAFAGATVHDMFNFMTVALLFPVELITGYLERVANLIVPSDSDVADGDKWEGPVKKLVSPLGNLIIKANKSVTKAIANEEGTCDDNGMFYPVYCEDGVVSYESCTKVGLISCDKATGKCPAFFQDKASKADDMVSGAVVFFLALVILIICLVGLVTCLQKMLMGVSTRIIYKATNVNGYLAIVIGTGITILVQSSSITTSALTPFVGIGAIRLEQMLPLTLGANIGTTFTGLLASLVSDEVAALQVAICHLFFNITGILIFYPIPRIRQIPLDAARQLGKATRIWRGFPILYIFVVFFIIPIILFGLSSLFEQDAKGYTILGAILVVILVSLFLFILYKWRRGGLRERTIESFKKRQEGRAAMASLPKDMEGIQSELARLRDHVGLAELEEEAGDEEEA